MCNKAPDTKWIDAMRKAGFGLQHLKCKNCGVHHIFERDSGEDRSRLVLEIKKKYGEA
jgi:hypothetical protein